MSFHLRNQSGRHCHLNNSGWSVVRAACEEHGWRPRGTVIDGDPSWEGGYDSNDGQVVTAEDALAMASAMELAIAAGRAPFRAEMAAFFVEFCREGAFEIVDALEF